MIKENETTIEKAGWNLDNSYTDLPKLFYSETNLNHVKFPEIVIYNDGLGESLGLDNNRIKSSQGAEIFAGNKIPKGSIPIAQVYAGHQFGYFTRLGDGRALLIGEQITPSGQIYDIQLKGSGRTPYSRGGDGRATLGPMLREYIISEAMNSLGIPTTRALAVTTTGESVIRETKLPGAVLTRIASSHLRVGTFEYVANWGTIEELKKLADYALNRHYPKAMDTENPYLSLLCEVIKSQAELIAKWQLVGFVHGVMNTDNMTISGETIDYGPCAFMDTYDPATVFSSIDAQGRYAYGNQPSIGNWNLARFAETLIPLLHEDQKKAVNMAQNAVSEFDKFFNFKWISGMRAKLGIFNQELEDKSLIQQLLDLMHKHNADYTNTFRNLTFEKLSDIPYSDTIEFIDWHKRWQERLKRQQETKNSIHQLMKNSNPAVIPRNHIVEQALNAAVKKEDYTLAKKLLEVFSCPYAHSPEQEEYTTLPEESSVPYVTFCGT